MNQNECCKYCKFYRGGSCKRYPPKTFKTRPHPEPSAGNLYEDIFPYMAENDWCGEFQRRAES